MYTKSWYFKHVSVFLSIWMYRFGRVSIVYPIRPGTVPWLLYLVQWWVNLVIYTHALSPLQSFAFDFTCLLLWVPSLANPIRVSMRFCALEVVTFNAKVSCRSKQWDKRSKFISLYDFTIINGYFIRHSVIYEAPQLSVWITNTPHEVYDSNIFFNFWLSIQI